MERYNIYYSCILLLLLLLYRLVVIVVFSSSLLCMCSTMPISTYDTSLGKLKNVNYGLRVLKEFAVSIWHVQIQIY